MLWSSCGFVRGWVFHQFATQWISFGFIPMLALIRQILVVLVVSGLRLAESFWCHSQTDVFRGSPRLVTHEYSALPLASSVLGRLHRVDEEGLVENGDLSPLEAVVDVFIKLTMKTSVMMTTFPCHPHLPISSDLFSVFGCIYMYTGTLWEGRGLASTGTRPRIGVRTAATHCVSGHAHTR